MVHCSLWLFVLMKIISNWFVKNTSNHTNHLLTLLKELLLRNRLHLHNSVVGSHDGVLRLFLVPYPYLHLHCFNNQQHVSLLYPISVLHVHTRNRAGHRTENITHQRFFGSLVSSARRKHAFHRVNIVYPSWKGRSLTWETIQSGHREHLHSFSLSIHKTRNETVIDLDLQLVLETLHQLYSKHLSAWKRNRIGILHRRIACHLAGDRRSIDFHVKYSGERVGIAEASELLPRIRVVARSRSK